MTAQSEAKIMKSTITLQNHPLTASIQYYQGSQRNMKSSLTHLRPSSASTYHMNLQRSTTEHTALNTISGIPRPGVNISSDTYGLMQRS